MFFSRKFTTLISENICFFSRKFSLSFFSDYPLPAALLFCFLLKLPLFSNPITFEMLASWHFSLLLIICDNKF